MEPEGPPKSLQGIEARPGLGGLRAGCSMSLPPVAGTCGDPTSGPFRLAGRQRLARAAQQRMASQRRGQGPHWFNISFSFQSIVTI